MPEVSGELSVNMTLAAGFHITFNKTTVKQNFTLCLRFNKWNKLFLCDPFDFKITPKNKLVVFS